MALHRSYTHVVKLLFHILDADCQCWLHRQLANLTAYFEWHRCADILLADWQSTPLVLSHLEHKTYVLRLTRGAVCEHLCSLFPFGALRLVLKAFGFRLSVSPFIRLSYCYRISPINSLLPSSINRHVWWLFCVVEQGRCVYGLWRYVHYVFLVMLLPLHSIRAPLFLRSSSASRPPLSRFSYPWRFGQGLKLLISANAVAHPESFSYLFG